MAERVAVGWGNSLRLTSHFLIVRLLLILCDILEIRHRLPRVPLSGHKMGAMMHFHGECAPIYFFLSRLYAGVRMCTEREIAGSVYALKRT